LAFTGEIFFLTEGLDGAVAAFLEILVLRAMLVLMDRWILNGMGLQGQVTDPSLQQEMFRFY
jgi:hypothetical protein